MLDYVLFVLQLSSDYRYIGISITDCLASSIETTRLLLDRIGESERGPDMLDLEVPSEFQTKENGTLRTHLSDPAYISGACSNLLHGYSKVPKRVEWRLHSGSQPKCSCYSNPIFLPIEGVSDAL